MQKRTFRNPLLAAAVVLGLAALVLLARSLAGDRAAPGARPTPPRQGQADGEVSGATLEGPAPISQPAGPPDAGPTRVAPSAPERGALVLRVVDRATGRPGESAVELHRLDGPGTTGPVRVAVPLEGATVEDLPAGRYRAHVRARLRAGEDPPPFQVVPPRTEVLLRVDLPGTYRVTLEVRDEEGRPVRMARASSGHEPHPEFRPPFAAGAEPPSDSRRGMSFGWRNLSVEEDHRFVLGQVRDLDCDRGGMPWYELNPRDRSPVRVELPGHELFSDDVFRPAPADLELLAVSLPETFFDRSVVLPDEVPARDRGARFVISCDARLLGPEDAGAPWMDVPVRVSVELDGYEPLRFEYRLREGPPARRELEPLRG